MNFTIKRTETTSIVTLSDERLPHPFIGIVRPREAGEGAPNEKWGWWVEVAGETGPVPSREFGEKHAIRSIRSRVADLAFQMERFLLQVKSTEPDALN